MPIQKNAVSYCDNLCKRMDAIRLQTQAIQWATIGTSSSLEAMNELNQLING